MTQKIKWVSNEGSSYYKKPSASLESFTPDVIAGVRRFHSTFPGYKPTPLHSLPALAKALGVKHVFLKDESHRFGLNAFKVLGGSYAIAQLLAQKLGKNLSDLPYDVLTSDAIREQLGEVVFATTTDGNHGRGVAWTARVLKQKSVVFMPKGSSQRRIDHIEAEGGEVTVRDCNYDESVRLTAQEAEKNGWIVVQDTAWPGYEDIPLWIMQGYGTMADEAVEQLRAAGVEEPSHVFIQAGVGSLAGTVQGVCSTYFKNPPRVSILEADKADCFYKSAMAGDGKPHAVGGDLDTLMAGLACGEANTIAYDILRDYSAAFVSCPDYVAAHGMRMLASPLKGDPAITSGESGAVGAGLLALALKGKDLAALKEDLKLTADSTVLLFSSEGDTDPERYRSVVWGGEFATNDLFEGLKF